jgi:hypothetical protein
LIGIFRCRNRADAIGTSAVALFVLAAPQAAFAADASYLTLHTAANPDWMRALPDATHHGSTYQNANFDDVLNKLSDFLGAHPGDTPEPVLAPVGDPRQRSGGRRRSATSGARSCSR